MRILRLDGLRAVAILAVLLHHHSIMRGGWVGVDLFFVLSGYLITAILRRDRERPHFWKRFYIKRATRILPPVLLLIGLVALVFRPPFISVLHYLFFLGNLASTSRHHGIPQLIMLWSLAVEEHFYVAFPFAVRFLSRRALILLLAGTILVEPLLRYFATSHLHLYTQIYFWTPFRLDGLAMGALLATLIEDARAKAWLTQWSGLCAAVGCLAFGAASFLMPGRFDREANSHLFNTTGYSTLSGACAFLIAYILLHSEAWPSKILGWRPLVFLGTISYGLYLDHQWVRVLTIHYSGLGPRRVFPLSFAIAVAVSWLSFRWYEAPLIRLGHLWAARFAEEKPPVSTLVAQR